MPGVYPRGRVCVNRFVFWLTFCFSLVGSQVTWMANGSDDSGEGKRRSECRSILESLSASEKGSCPGEVQQGFETELADQIAKLMQQVSHLGDQVRELSTPDQRQKNEAVDTARSGSSEPAKTSNGRLRVRISPRNPGNSIHIVSETSLTTVSPEQITRITGGVNIQVEGMGGENGVMDLSADRVVMFAEDFGTDKLKRTEMNHRIRLEGNVVIRLAEYQIEAQDVFVETRHASTVQARQAKQELLFFSAPWCGPCQQMNPLVERLKKQGFSIRSVDVDQDAALTRKHHVDSIPCFVMLNGDNEVSRISGSTTEAKLKDLFGKPDQCDQIAPVPQDNPDAAETNTIP